MQRPNLRATRRQTGPGRTFGRRGELYISTTQANAVCDAPLCRKHIAAETAVKRRTGCVQVTCLDCDFPKELGNYQ